MLNVAKLNSAMKQRGLTPGALASRIGVSRSTFYRKVKDGGNTFLVWEINAIIKHLGISVLEAIEIFFP